MIFTRELAKRGFELENKWEMSGIDGEPVISDDELVELFHFYDGMHSYFVSIDHCIISIYFKSRRESVQSTLTARGVEIL